MLLWLTHHETHFYRPVVSQLALGELDASRSRRRVDTFAPQKAASL